MTLARRTFLVALAGLPFAARAQAPSESARSARAGSAPPSARSGSRPAIR